MPKNAESAFTAPRLLDRGALSSEVEGASPSTIKSTFDAGRRVEFEDGRGARDARSAAPPRRRPHLARSQSITEDAQEVGRLFRGEYRANRGMQLWDCGPGLGLSLNSLRRNSTCSSGEPSVREVREASVAEAERQGGGDLLCSPATCRSAAKKAKVASAVSMLANWRAQFHFDAQKQAALKEIRVADMQDPLEMLEQPLPDVKQTFPGIVFQARDENYWKALLGIEERSREPCAWADSWLWVFLVGTMILTNAYLFSVDEYNMPPTHRLIRELIFLFSMVDVVLFLYRLRGGVAFEVDEIAIGIVDLLSVMGCLLIQWIPEISTLLLRGILDGGSVTRLLWLMRFVRLISIIPKLREIVRGVIEAISGLMWVLVFLFILLFMAGVVTTLVIGPKDVLGMSLVDRIQENAGELADEAQDLIEHFGDIGDSMYLLFGIMNAGALEPLEPLFRAVPWTRWLLSLFYVYAGWTLLAVMTGTVSFSMISLTAADDTEREEERRLFIEQMLQDIFNRLDADGSGELEHEEFEVLMTSPEMVKILAEYTNIKISDLAELWDFLDDDKSGSVTTQEFMQGFHLLNESLRPKSLIRLQEAVAGDIFKVRNSTRDLVETRFDHIRNEVTSPLSKLNAVAEQVQIVLAGLQDYKQEIVRTGTADIETLEAKMQEQMDNISARISNFRVVKVYNSAMTSEEPVQHPKFNRLGSFLMQALPEDLVGGIVGGRHTQRRVSTYSAAADGPRQRSKSVRSMADKSADVRRDACM